VRESGEGSDGWREEEGGTEEDRGREAMRYCRGRRERRMERRRKRRWERGWVKKRD
jgi:hypothetical protein